MRRQQIFMGWHMDMERNEYVENAPLFPSTYKILTFQEAKIYVILSICINVCNMFFIPVWQWKKKYIYFYGWRNDARNALYMPIHTYMYIYTDEIYWYRTKCVGNIMLFVVVVFVASAITCGRRMKEEYAEWNLAKRMHRIGIEEGERIAEIDTL